MVHSSDSDNLVKAPTETEAIFKVLPSLDKLRIEGNAKIKIGCWSTWRPHLFFIFRLKNRSQAYPPYAKYPRTYSFAPRAYSL